MRDRGFSLLGVGAHRAELDDLKGAIPLPHPHLAE
jgi:hypothetical protein